LQQTRTGQRPQLAAQRLRGCDQQVAQLAETGTLGVDRAFACGHQRLQRLAFTTCPRRPRPLLAEHTAGGAGSVERVGLAARAALSPQPSHLEHRLATIGEKACQPGTERAGAFDRERAPTGSVLVDELHSMRVAVAARHDRRLKHDHAADDVHDRERMRVAVWVDTDDVVQLICKHPNRPPAQALGDTNRCRSGVETADGITVTGHALETRTGF
jgi:hypothetical protein